MIEQDRRTSQERIATQLLGQALLEGAEVNLCDSKTGAVCSISRPKLQPQNYEIDYYSLDGRVPGTCRHEQYLVTQNGRLIEGYALDCLRVSKLDINKLLERLFSLDRMKNDFNSIETDRVVASLDPVRVTKSLEQMGGTPITLYWIPENKTLKVCFADPLTEQDGILLLGEEVHERKGVIEIDDLSLSVALLPSIGKCDLRLEAGKLNPDLVWSGVYKLS